MTHGKSPPHVHIVGAGLSGSEAAYFLAQSGIDVTLHEMRPLQMTPAHKTESCAELVCSNSFKSQSPHSAPGMLKAEMLAMGSLILKSAEKFKVPAGESLAVDRDLFSKEITTILKNHPRIRFENHEITDASIFENGIALLATGPLTSEALSLWLLRATGAEDLYFYDAIAPIVDASSIDYTRCWTANRYDKGGEEAYVNCPMSEKEYYAFIDALALAEKVAPKSFEKEKYFQGCQPIEAIAQTGRDSLRFGPMKPVGLVNPTTGKTPFAVVQLRAENQSKTAYNLVGFQTKLKYGEQSRIFRMIPALHQAEFLRLGSVHRNTYVCGPKVLRGDLSLKGHPRVYLAGQMTGVEGYLESAACGLLAALFIFQRIRNRPHNPPPPNTALGALLQYITASDASRYQPSNANFSLFESHFFENTSGLKKDQLRLAMAEQASKNFTRWWNHSYV